MVGPGAIPEDAKQVAVNESGQVFAVIDGQVEPADLGQFEIATFANETGLEAIGDNLYLETPASGDVVVGTAGQPRVRHHEARDAGNLQRQHPCRRSPS